jgi:hypothetical protein
MYYGHVADPHYLLMYVSTQTTSEGIGRKCGIYVDQIFIKLLRGPDQVFYRFLFWTIKCEEV